MNRWTRALFTGLLVATLMTPPMRAEARVESSAIAHVAVTVPDAWATTTQGNSVIVRAPTGGMAIEFHYITSAAELTAARTQFEAAINQNFQSAAYDGPARPVRQNGMVGALRRGRGMMNGQEMGFMGGFLAHQTGGVIIIAWVTRAGLAANLPTLQAILNSIRPA